MRAVTLYAFVVTVYGKLVITTKHEICHDMQKNRFIFFIFSVFVVSFNQSRP